MPAVFIRRICDAARRRARRLLQEVAPHPRGAAWPAGEGDVAPVVIAASGVEVDPLTLAALQRADHGSRPARAVVRVDVAGDLSRVATLTLACGGRHALERSCQLPGP